MFYGTLNRFPTVGKCFLNIFWAVTAVLCKSGNHYNKLPGEPCADVPGALGPIFPWSLLSPVLSHSVWVLQKNLPFLQGISCWRKVFGLETVPSSIFSAFPRGPCAHAVLHTGHTVVTETVVGIMKLTCTIE